MSKIKKSKWHFAPPSVEEVMRYQWWWNRAPDVEPHVLQLDLDGMPGEPGCDKIMVIGQGMAIPFLVSDWGGKKAQWCPCLPPD